MPSGPVNFPGSAFRLSCWGMDASEEDAALLARGQQGDPGAWELLVQRHAGFLFGLASSRMRRAGFGAGEAEEVVQEVWATLLRKRPGELPERLDFRPYAAVMVMNGVRTWLARGRSRTAREQARIQPRAPEAPDEPLLKGEDLARLEAGMADLGPDDQLLLRWIYWEGLTYAQVARLLGVARGTVGARLSEVRARLRQTLEKAK